MENETTEQTDVAVDVAVEAPTEETTAETVEETEADDSGLASRLSAEDMAYVKSLREEAKQNRVERDEYKSAFADLDPEGSKALLEAVKLITADPAMAHEAFNELAAGLAEAAGIAQAEATEILEEAQEDATEEEAPAFRTKADLDAYLAEREATVEKAKADAAAEKAFTDEITALGYKVDSEDVNEQLDTVALLKVAKDHTNGDLNKAHEIVEARKQVIVDNFLAGKAAQGAAYPPATTGTSGTNVPVKPEIKSVEAARLAAMQADAE